MYAHYGHISTMPTWRVPTLWLWSLPLSLLPFLYFTSFITLGCTIKGSIANITASLCPQTNSFQAAVLTDDSLSFAVFIYRCGYMDYSGMATIGFIATHNLCVNHPLSLYVNARNVACLNYPKSEWFHLIYRLTIPTGKYLYHFKVISLSTLGINSSTLPNLCIHATFMFF